MFALSGACADGRYDTRRVRCFIPRLGGRLSGKIHWLWLSPFCCRYRWHMATRYPICAPRARRQPAAIGSHAARGQYPIHEPFAAGDRPLVAEGGIGRHSPNGQVEVGVSVDGLASVCWNTRCITKSGVTCSPDNIIASSSLPSTCGAITTSGCTSFTRLR